MSKTVKIILIGLGVAVLGAAAYFLIAGGKDRLLKFIPNNAAFVVRVDVKGMYDLGKQNNLFELKMMQDGMKESKKEGGMGKIIAAVLEKPEECGIDFRKPAYLFGEMMSRGKATAMLMELSSESKFADFINKKRDSDTKMEKTSEFNHIELDAGEYLSWGNGILVYSVNKTESTGYPAGIMKRSRPGMEGNLNMKEMLNTNGMVTFMFRPGETLKWSEDNVDLPIKDFWNPEMMSKAMTYIGKLDFVKGGITMMAKAYSADGKKGETPELLKKSNNALKLARYAKKETVPALLMTCNFNMNGLMKYISDNLEGDSKSEFENNELIKMLNNTLNGEFMLCLPTMESGDSASRNNPALQLVAGTNKNNSEFESKLRELNIEKTNGTYNLNMGLASIPLSVNDDHIILGESGNSKIKTGGLDENYLNSPMFIMVDFEKLLNSIPSSANEGKALRKSGMTVMFGYTNESVNSDIKFKDKEKNGLASLLELIDKTIKEEEERKARLEKELENLRFTEDQPANEEF
jgi:hypothetical protein